MGDAQVQKEDWDYLLSILRHYFPSISWDYKDVIASYAGLRPLLKSPASDTTTTTTATTTATTTSTTPSLSVGQTSREHSIWRANPHITFIAGGKYTTYRKVAQEVVDFCLSAFPIWERAEFQYGQSKQALHPQCSLENLQKAKENTEAWMKKYPQYEAQALSAFIHRHAMEAEELLEKHAFHCKNLWQIEAYYAMEKGSCHHLKDFYRRYPALTCLQDPKYSSSY